MVVERSGVTKVVADLLRKSEFLNRLLYSADEPKDDPILLVAVVRVDDVADTRYQEDSAKFKKRREHFADVCEESKKLVINQVRQQLEAVWSSSEGPPSDGRSKVSENVLSTLQVHSLSAVQLRRLLTCDPDDPPLSPTQGKAMFRSSRRAWLSWRVSSGRSKNHDGRKGETSSLNVFRPRSS